MHACRSYLSAILLALALVTSPFGLAQGNLTSPEVHPDGRVTFRLLAPDAEKVTLTGLAEVTEPGLTRGEQGVWNVTVGPLEPGIYSYSFAVDGTKVLDYRNRNIKAWLSLENQVEVPGNPPLRHEWQSVPHGTVHQHFYRSDSLAGPRTLFVYTPPGYKPGTLKNYPVVYLLHGHGDDASAWTTVGRAHFIADNLLMHNRVEEMIIVMPDGHPLPRGQGSNYGLRNLELLERDLLDDIIPLIEENYAVSKKASKRAIVGLSMGGGQAIHIGLRHLDTFEWVGAFSAAAPEDDLDALYPLLLDPKSKARKDMRLLWIGCGKDDFLLQRNGRFVDWLIESEIPHTYKLTEGGHEWPVWRNYLAEFLQQLFR